MSLGKLLEPIPLGILLGLFVGKQVGVFTFAWLAVKSGLARLPDGRDLRARSTALPSCAASASP